MNAESLDVFFPWFVLAYGVFVTIALSLDVVARWAEQHVPHDALARLRAHRTLAAFCLVVGAAWTLQNLIFA